MAIDLERAQSRAQRAYELARVRRGLLYAAPLGVVVLLAASVGYRADAILPLGVLLYISAAIFLWRGRALGEAVLPGALAGVLPLALALCAKGYGHVCTGSECVSLCVPACVAGGMLAGGMISSIARRRVAWAHAGAPFVLGASFIALVTGSLGCSCVGFGGVIGLLGGLTLPVVARLVRGFGNARV